MDARELRIGNYLNVINITPVKITANHILAISEGDEQYSPIPITDEWLEKFGFKESETVKYSDEFKGARKFEIPKLLDMVFSIDGKFYYILDINTNDYGDDIYTSRQITFIHQLQNFFFASTSTELQLK